MKNRHIHVGSFSALALSLLNRSLLPNLDSILDQDGLPNFPQQGVVLTGVGSGKIAMHAV